MSGCKEQWEEKKRLPREFFARDGITVAKELLGKVLVHKTEVGIIRGGDYRGGKLYGRRG